MRILIAPLNWGLGHASRCVPLVRKYLAEGHSVVLGGDGESFILLRKTFPTLEYVHFPEMHLRYSSGKSQTGAMLRNMPRILFSLLKDHLHTKYLASHEHFDLIISDNRFGMFPPKNRTHKATRYVYITHQLHIPMPCGWEWMGKIADKLHKAIWCRYDEVWVPDYSDEKESLAGELSHPATISEKVRYIGPLSRMEKSQESVSQYDVVAVLSGIEPQRSMLEEELTKQYAGKSEEVLIVRGKTGESNVKIRHGNITKTAYMSDGELIPILNGAKKIICRSGYSSIMDLARLGMLEKAELIPTPGQPEQEYLARYIQQKKNTNRPSPQG